ncbi:UNVERIFIED_CONTAM: hypothetical protein Scaly_2544000 [Sesamum calycinum]|uniref:Retrovirus-related Pol polyprotein from transposon TNT 1-94-like beta-barrel domain-containing protein n=1 Tax=Sesamum calycinum TaxID=2727403 RepID=A0AAW2J5J4_9LAMI
MMSACITKERDIGKREYPQLLSNQSMFVVEVNMITNFVSWVLGAECGSHICNDMQVAQRSRKLTKNEMILRLGNDKAIVVEIVGLVELTIDHHVRVVLNDCFYIPNMIKKIILILVLDKERYNFEAFGRYKKYRLEVENQTGPKIKTLLVGPRFIGYPTDIVGYYFYGPFEQKIFISHNTVFLEKDFLLDSRCDEILLEKSSEVSHETSKTASTPIVPTDSVPILRRSARVTQPRGMKSEMDSMGSNQVWTLVDPTKGFKPVGCKWVYKCKLVVDGEVINFKARLVVKDDILLIGNDVKMLEDRKLVNSIFHEGYGVTSQYQACAREAHWNAVKTIIKYLKMTKDMSLIYGGGELIMEAYNDASFHRTMTMPSPSLVMYSNLMVVWLIGKVLSRLPWQIPP